MSAATYEWLSQAVAIVGTVIGALGLGALAVLAAALCMGDPPRREVEPTEPERRAA